MKKPNLAQLRKRPALWWGKKSNTLIISYPNGKTEMYYEYHMLFYSDEWIDSLVSFSYLIQYCELLSWL